MDRVGGDYGSYLALCEDAQAYDDVLIAMEGEADARRWMEMERERKASRR